MIKAFWRNPATGNIEPLPKPITPDAVNDKGEAMFYPATIADSYGALWALWMDRNSTPHKKSTFVYDYNKTMWVYKGSK